MNTLRLDRDGERRAGIKEDSIVFRLETDVGVQYLMKRMGAFLTHYKPCISHSGLGFLDALASMKRFSP